MAATPTVYVICDQNCKFEGMTKEQILTAIVQAVETGEIRDVDTGFITTIKTINGVPLKFFCGERWQYEELSEEEKENLYAIITNEDGSAAGIIETIEKLSSDMTEILGGERAVPKAQRAAAADKISDGWIDGGKYTVKTCNHSEAASKLNFQLDPDALYAIKIKIDTAKVGNTLPYVYYDTYTVLFSTMSGGSTDNISISTPATCEQSLALEYNKKLVVFIKDFGVYGKRLMLKDTTTGENVEKELSIIIEYKKIF